MAGLSEILAATEDVMQSKFAAARKAVDHSGMKGMAVEEIVRKFLADHLPPSVGVTVGQVMDADGTRSKQADVIVYNANRSPMLFTSDQAGQNVVSAEGVIAVVEVKSRLTKSLLPEVLANCRSVKTLKKDAYVGPPVNKFNVYGQMWPDFPTLYSVFAFESDSLYAEELNQLHQDVPVSERIDSVCSLDRGLNLNILTTFDPAGPKVEFSAVANPNAALVDIKTDRALMKWFVVVSALFMQADSRPVDLTRYVNDELAHEATMGGTAGYKPILHGLSTQLGLDPQILEKLLIDKQQLSDDEYTALKNTGMTLSNIPGFTIDPNDYPQASS